MPYSRLPRIVGFEVPPLKTVVDVVRDAPIVALLDGSPSRDWLDAFIVEVACTRGPLRSALVTVEDDRVFFFASAAEGRTRCDAVRAMVERVGSRLVANGPSAQERSPIADLVGDFGEARRVLVVEDDEALREIACDVLAGGGWGPQPAASLPEALAALDGTSFHAVLADIDLDEREQGLELARTVRTRWPDGGVVAVTGRHADGMLALPQGVVFLGKPYQRRQLLAVLDLACLTSGRDS
ncbi:CheY-like chemotaxis protein [Luteibacter sp. 621]|uniref:response regulator n=1 Tax=Luteibacter sp. 621 TaxID=3373916 RepID=UPI003D22E710